MFKRHTFWIHLSSGRVIRVRAEKLVVTISNSTGHVVGYNVEGMSRRQRRIFSVDPTHIIAVETR